MNGSVAISRFGLALGAFALVASGCSGKADKVATIKSTSTTEATTTTVEETTTTLPPSTTAKPAPPPGLGQGSRGPEVQALEAKLAEMKYDVGKVDGVYDSLTFHAVMAFQKVEGMRRSGRATPDVLAAVKSAGPPGALLAAGGANRVEIDIKRQVLFLYKGGGLFRILSVSTGSGKRYCVDGACATAVTPGGSFRVTRRISGWRTSRLGRLYNPLYFNGGIAIHGSGSVPAYPASHGCVRITMAAAGWFPGAVSNGTPVYVVGGPKAPVPFNEPAPTDLQPDSATTTTTTAPAPTTTAPPTTSTFPFPTTTTTATPPDSVPPPPGD
jgi:peptidoglycan hydrolase-like protein with peptidoglycan-binding domain